MNTDQQGFYWDDFEYIPREKSSDWFWALGIITLAATATAIILNNVLFAVMLLVGGFVIALFASRQPDRVTFELNERGLKINQRLYPFQTMEIFWIDDGETRPAPTLLLQSTKTLMPHIVVPLNNVDSENVRQFLSARGVKEDEFQESDLHRFIEALIFH